MFMRFNGSATAWSRTMPFGMHAAPRTLQPVAGSRHTEQAVTQGCAQRGKIEAAA